MGLAEDMRHNDHPWFTADVLFAIALFATVSALACKLLFGRSVVTVLIGLAIAVAAVLAFMTIAGRTRATFIK